MIDKKTYNQYAADPAAFRNNLLVDVDGVARRFGKVQDDWQRDDFQSLDPGLLRCIGRSENTDAKMRAWWERARGHSKSSDIAMTCCYALIFCNRPIKGYVFACDKDQAAILKDAMDTICRLNPWINEILDVQKTLVVNKASDHPGKGATLKIESSDIGSSYGLLADFLVAEEACNWCENTSALWDSIISSAAKRKNCLFIVLTNAGFCETWQWRVREAARNDPAWIFSRLDGSVASWIDQDRLAEQERMLPAIAFARLWKNQWSSGGGDALTPSDIAAAFDSSLEPMTGEEKDMLFICGVDLGLVRDSSAVVVLAVPAGGKSGRIQLAHSKVWKPVPNRKLDLMDIERHILELDKQFNLENVAADSWQAELLCQQLEADSGHSRRNQRRRFNRQPWVRVINPTPSNLRQQASLLIECFADRRFRFFDCDPLRTDLNKLRIEEKTYGFRCTSPRDGDGHGDTFSAFALALLVAHELAGKPPKKIATMGTEDGGGNNEACFSALDKMLQREIQDRKEDATMAEIHSDDENFLLALREARLMV